MPAGQLPVQRVRQRGSVYPKTKPALVYTSIHSTVTASHNFGMAENLSATLSHPFFVGTLECQKVVKAVQSACQADS
jgi:hypothetical protein